MDDRKEPQSRSPGTADTLPAPDHDGAPDADRSDDFLRDIARIDEGPPRSAHLAGTRLGRFDLVALLGQGGMGVVYRAVDRHLGRDVAVKLIRGDAPSLAARLLQEARAQARVDHEGVCKVFEVGEASGKAFIAMQLVEGRPLGEAAASMSLHQKVQAVRDVARALHAAHVLGIVHRDVKPSNVLVEPLEDGSIRPVVMDFGLARDQDDTHGLTETGDVMGTPAYMSPEQARGDRRALDRRSDVWSLGATFHELLAGAPPFDGGNAMMIVHAVLNDEPPSLRARVRSLPEDLETIVAKCLRKDPGQRYDSAKALAEDLDRYIRGEPILGRRESLVARLRRRAKKHRALVLVAALAVVALGTTGGLGLRARVVAHRHAVELAAEAELGRELGQEVKEMEWFLRSAKMLPLHDLTRERAVVKEKMKHLDERAASGAAARAQVDYAVGRGHLALDDDAEAVERLERAERGGLDTPELHYALGVARGRLYQKALLDVRNLPDERAIARRKQEIEEEHLKPALASMEKSRDVRLEAQSYLPGLIAHYRKDYAGALALAEKAREEAPWLYEAIALQADVLLARGIDHRVHHDHDAAARDMEEAARLYDVAAESGRSDAGLYEGSAEAWAQRMNTEATGTTQASLEDSLARAVDRCEKAAVVRPDTSAPYIKMASALRRMAFHLLRRAADARPILSRALAALDRARAIGGNGFDIYLGRASALTLRALYEVHHGFDPSVSLNQGFADARHAVELAPMNPAGHSMLGVILSDRARHMMGTGGDPEPDLRAALDSNRRSYAIDESYGGMRYHNSALANYMILAEWKASRGRDPSEEVLLARDAFAECVKVDAYPYCYGNMAVAEEALAEYQTAAGLDAREALARALEHYQKANALGPGEWKLRVELALVHLLRAEDAIHRGDDPAPALEALGPLLADCYRHDAKEPVSTYVDARRALVLADVDVRAHRSERASLDRARALGLLAIERNPRSTYAHQVLAEANRRLAALAAPPAEQAKHRAAGLDACTRGLALNPNHPRLLATQGGLLLLEARASQDGAAKASSSRKARDALRRAVELNPLLRREVGPLLDEAERLGG